MQAVMSSLRCDTKKIMVSCPTQVFNTQLPIGWSAKQSVRARSGLQKWLLFEINLSYRVDSDPDFGPALCRLRSWHVFFFIVEALQLRVRHGPTFLQIVKSPEGPARGLDRPPTFYAFTASPALFCLTPITMSLWRFRPQRVLKNK